MEKKKTNILLVIIIVLLLAIIGYLVYKEYTQTVDNTNYNQNQNENIKTPNAEVSETSVEESTIKEEPTKTEKVVTEVEYLKGVKKDDTNMTEKLLKEKGNLLFTKNNIKLYKYANEEEIDFYVVNNKNNYVYKAFPFDQNEKTNLFFITYYEEIVGMINVDKMLVNTDYNDYSCGFHSDVSAITCKDNKTTIVNKSDKFGVIEVDTLKVVLNAEYDNIVEDTNGNFIITKNNKYGLVTNKGETLLAVEYDYLVQSTYFGYLTIKDNNLEAYQNDLTKIDLKKNGIVNLYNEAYKAYQNDPEYEEKDNELTFNSPNSYYWSQNAIVFKFDLSKKYGDFNLKYIGNKYSGTKVVILDQKEACYGKKPFIYILDDTKAYKTTDIKIEMETCF